jgi:DNA-binding GntR family transcriptional regulator
MSDLAGVCWADHVELVEAVAARDTATARQLTREYNVHTRALIEKLAPTRS